MESAIAKKLPAIVDFFRDQLEELDLVKMGSYPGSDNLFTALGYIKPNKLREKNLKLKILAYIYRNKQFIKYEIEQVQRNPNYIVSLDNYKILDYDFALRCASLRELEGKKDDLIINKIHEELRSLPNYREKNIDCVTKFFNVHKKKIFEEMRQRMAASPHALEELSIDDDEATTSTHIPSSPSSPARRRPTLKPLLPAPTASPSHSPVSTTPLISRPQPPESRIYKEARRKLHPVALESKFMMFMIFTFLNFITSVGNVAIK
ncbi:uncharacterized protein LOC122859670 [Aphidius gifuensis]|uniref:uncharacterized protein LOC122859670 n=1 Tax=Aphidius gifuensis TaxID=684658 RepID=UPI001CDD1DB0|nr:uncharacterized protein LOC122859670 [Aphidius gifuensis]